MCGINAGEYVDRKQGSDRWIIDISSFSRGILYEGRARGRKENGGCFSLDQKPGSGKSILPVRNRGPKYCTAMSNAGQLRGPSNVVTCILKLRKGGLALVFCYGCLIL